MADKQKAAKNAKEKKPGFFKRLAKYFRDVWGEFKKIVWPSRKQVINNTIVVFVTCLVFAVAIWVLDIVFGLLRGLII